MPIPARSARAQRANRRESGPSGPSTHARDAIRKCKPTETEPTNTRTLADYYSVQVPEPCRPAEPRCILRPCPAPEQHTLGAVALVAVAAGSYVNRVDRVNHELELADVGGARINQVDQVDQVDQIKQGGHVNQVSQVSPWQAFGNTLYEAWLKGPCEN